MGFESLCGNAALKNRLQTAVAAGKTAHSYLIVGPEGSGRRTLARLLCAALECNAAPSDAPCLRCMQCRKVLDGNHPDVMWLGDPEKKTITVAEARQVKSELYILPNEGKKKIFVFPPSHLLGREAQNALLKVVEEPPEYGVFLFLTERAEQLLPTIRSRCAELMMAPVEPEEAISWLSERYPKQSQEALSAAYRGSYGFLGAAERLLRSEDDESACELAIAYAERQEDRWAMQLFKMEKFKREQLQKSLVALHRIFAEALTAKFGREPSQLGRKLKENRTAAELMSICKVTEMAISAADQNGGVGHICGFLAAKWQ